MFVDKTIIFVFVALLLTGLSGVIHPDLTLVGLDEGLDGSSATQVLLYQVSVTTLQVIVTKINYMTPTAIVTLNYHLRHFL